MARRSKRNLRQIKHLEDNGDESVGTVTNDSKLTNVNASIEKPHKGGLNGEPQNINLNENKIYPTLTSILKDNKEKFPIPSITTSQLGGIDRNPLRLSLNDILDGNNCHETIQDLSEKSTEDIKPDNELPVKKRKKENYIDEVLSEINYDPLYLFNGVSPSQFKILDDEYLDKELDLDKDLNVMYSSAGPIHTVGTSTISESQEDINEENICKKEYLPYDKADVDSNINKNGNYKHKEHWEYEEINKKAEVNNWLEKVKLHGVKNKDQILKPASEEFEENYEIISEYQPDSPKKTNWKKSDINNSSSETMDCIISSEIKNCRISNNYGSKGIRDQNSKNGKKSNSSKGRSAKRKNRKKSNKPEEDIGKQIRSRLQKITSGKIQIEHLQVPNTVVWTNLPNGEVIEISNEKNSFIRELLSTAKFLGSNVIGTNLNQETISYLPTKLVNNEEFRKLKIGISTTRYEVIRDMELLIYIIDKIQNREDVKNLQNLRTNLVFTATKLEQSVNLHRDYAEHIPEAGKEWKKLTYEDELLLWGGRQIIQQLNLRIQNLTLKGTIQDMKNKLENINQIPGKGKREFIQFTNIGGNWSVTNKNNHITDNKPSLLKPDVKEINLGIKENPKVGFNWSIQQDNRGKVDEDLTKTKSELENIKIKANLNLKKNRLIKSTKDHEAMEKIALSKGK